MGTSSAVLAKSLNHCASSPKWHPLLSFSCASLFFLLCLGPILDMLVLWRVRCFARVSVCEWEEDCVLWSILNEIWEFGACLDGDVSLLLAMSLTAKMGKLRHEEWMCVPCTRQLGNTSVLSFEAWDNAVLLQNNKNVEFHSHSSLEVSLLVS